MSENNFWAFFWSAVSIVIITITGSVTYFNVTEVNNQASVVTKAIERGLDPVSAACAANILTPSTRNTCEKYFLIRGAAK